MAAFKSSRWGDYESSDEEDSCWYESKEQAAKPDTDEHHCGDGRDDFIIDDINGFLGTVSVSIDEKPVVDPRSASEDSSKEKKPRRRKFGKSDSQTHCGKPQQRGKPHQRGKPQQRENRSYNGDRQRRNPCKTEGGLSFLTLGSFNTQRSANGIVHSTHVCEKFLKLFGSKNELSVENNVFMLNSVLVKGNPKNPQGSIIINLTLMFDWETCSNKLKDNIIKFFENPKHKFFVSFKTMFENETFGKTSPKIAFKKCNDSFQRTPGNTQNVDDFVSDIGPWFMETPNMMYPFESTLDFLGVSLKSLLNFESVTTSDGKHFVFFSIDPDTLLEKKDDTEFQEKLEEIKRNMRINPMFV